MKKYLSLILVVSIFTSVFFAPVTHAAGCDQRILGIPPWHKGLCVDGEVKIGRDNPGASIGIIALNVFNIVFYVISYAAVAMVIFGGIKYLISTGDPAKATAARQTVQNALIGLLLGISAIAIVTFITENIKG